MKVNRDLDKKEFIEILKKLTKEDMELIITLIKKMRQV